MKLLKYKRFIIINGSIWFDNPDKEENECKSFMQFLDNNQAKSWIDLFHEKYKFNGERYDKK